MDSACIDLSSSYIIVQSMMYEAFIIWKFFWLFDIRHRFRQTDVGIYL